MYINNNERKRDVNVVKGALALTLSVIFVKIIGLVYKVPLSYVLGDDGMGYFNSAYTVFTFFYMLCSGGVPRAVSILITEMRVKGREETVPSVLRVALAVFVSLGAVFTLVFICFSGAISRMIGNSLSCFSLVAIAPALTFVAASGVLRGYLVGYGKMGSVALSEMLDASVKFIVGMSFALFALRRNLSSPMISAYTVIGVTLGAFIGSVILFISVNITKKEHKTEQKLQNRIKPRTVIRSILEVSLPITISSAIMGICNIVDLGMIMRRLGAIGIPEAQAVALYGNFTTLVVPMLNLVTALTSPIGTSALPRLAEDFARNDTRGFKEFFGRTVSVTAFFTVPIAVGFSHFPFEILSLIFKDESARAAAPLLVIIAPSVVLMPLLTMVHTALEASKHQRMPIISMLVLAAAKITSSYVLIGRLGIGGAPLGTTVSYALAFAVSVAILGFSVKVSPFVFLGLLRPMLCAFLAVGTGRRVYDAYSQRADQMLLFIICVMICIALYFIFMILLSMISGKKSFFSVIFNKKREA